MPGLVSKEYVAERLPQDARNSSHFVWLIANLQFFEATNRWIFGFHQANGVTLVALEPLIPGAPVEYLACHKQDFASAWKEFSEAMKIERAAFVSVYTPFLKLIQTFGWKSLKIGREPWIDLKDCIPRGNSGKGVRQARNSALRSGLTVEEWSAESIKNDPAKENELRKIATEWKSSRLIDVGGFLNAVDPFVFSERRRYFVARSEKRFEGFLVATPIGGINSYFLEDLLLRAGAPNGCGELLTLEAMVALSQSGANQASLGVVSLNTLGESKDDNISTGLKRSLKVVSRILQKFYNTSGMEMYRRRFKPHAWTDIHLAVLDTSGGSQFRAFAQTVFALLRALRPRLAPSKRWFVRTALRPIVRYPVTMVATIASFGLFAWVNGFGTLPAAILEKWSFYPNAPLVNWPLRSLVSDFLYFDRNHFLYWGIALTVMLLWAEKTHKSKWVLGVFVMGVLLGDSLSYLVITKPFEYFNPNIFHRLIANQDVGGSLLLTTFLGFQIHKFRSLREPVFALGCLSIVLLFLFNAQRIDLYALNVNHLLMFICGFMVGTVKLELIRRQSRRMSKKAPPLGKSVFQPRKLKTILSNERKKAVGE